MDISAGGKAHLALIVERVGLFNTTQKSWPVDESIGLRLWTICKPCGLQLSKTVAYWPDCNRASALRASE
jgi:hypothetical protein